MRVNINNCSVTSFCKDPADVKCLSGLLKKRLKTMKAQKSGVEEGGLKSSGDSKIETRRSAVFVCWCEEKIAEGRMEQSVSQSQHCIGRLVDKEATEKGLVKGGVQDADKSLCVQLDR